MRRSGMRRLCALSLVSCAAAMLGLAPIACGKYGAPKRAVPPVAAPSAPAAEEPTPTPEDDDERASREEETKR